MTQITVQQHHGGMVPVQMGRNWAAGLCDCCTGGCELCCNVYWCPQCMAGRIHSATMNGLNDVMDSRVTGGLIAAEVVGCVFASVLNVAGVPGGGICYSLGCLALAGYTRHQRQVIAAKYNIHHDVCCDCLISFFCTGCALCQHFTEARAHGVDPGSCCCAIQKTHANQTAVVMVAQQGQVVYPNQVVQPGYVGAPVGAPPAYPPPQLAPQPVQYGGQPMYNNNAAPLYPQVGAAHVPHVASAPPPPVAHEANAACASAPLPPQQGGGGEQV